MAEVPEQYKDVPGVFSYAINGREMWFKPPGSGPMILMQKYRAQLVNMARNDDPNYYKLAMDVTAKTLNIINNQFLDADDRDWVEEMILTEAVEIQEIIHILSGGKRSQEDDDKEIEVKPRKAVKAAPVKKAASAKRTRS